MQVMMVPIVVEVKNGKGAYGFDAAKEQYVDDMMDAGIIRPSKKSQGLPFKMPHLLRQ